MASEGLAEAYNSAQFLGRLEGGGSKGAMRVSTRDVVVVDEASQVPTAELAALAAVVRAGGARMILTGDTAQLGAVEAGGMMRLIAEDLGHWELAEVRRFDAEWERLASLQLRQGARAAVRAYDAHGRVRAGHQHAAEASAVGLYLADYLMGRDSLLLAGTNEEAAKLAGMVRAELVRVGQVAERPEVTLADGNGAAAGDLVRARQNTPAVDAAGVALTNRDTLRLEGVTLATGGRVAIMRRQLPGGGWSRDFPVPLGYLRQSAELAYAGNVYVAQGRTVDTAHVYASASLTRESLYVAMSRGRQANTLHVVTGPSPRPGQPDLAQAEPEAVLADILDRTESTRTATEAMREAQAFTTDTGHLLAMYSAATRPGVYAAVDAGFRARLSPAEYARYEGESQRPVLQRQVYAATLAGADLDEVLDTATGQELTGARSIAAVMHGRLKAARLGEAEHGQTVTWARRVPEVARPETRALGIELAQAIDTQAGELAREQAERPEPWVLHTLGAYPVDGSAQLQADWLARVGTAAGYRQAAGITDPNMVVGPAPQGHPELLTWHADAVGALEIPRENRMIWAMTQGQLEATAATGERIKATAPPEVSPELRAVRLAEADARARGAELSVLGEHQAAQDALARADAADVRATVLEGRAEIYAQWETDTAAERHAAELARSELEARAKAPEPTAVTEAETAAAGKSAELPDPAHTASELVDPDPAYELGTKIEDPEAAAAALVATWTNRNSPRRTPCRRSKTRNWRPWLRKWPPAPGPVRPRPRLVRNGWQRPKPTRPSAQPCARRPPGTRKRTLPRRGSRARARRPGAARRPARRRPSRPPRRRPPCRRSKRRGRSRDAALGAGVRQPVRCLQGVHLVLVGQEERQRRGGTRQRGDERVGLIAGAPAGHHPLHGVDVLCNGCADEDMGRVDTVVPVGPDVVGHAADLPPSPGGGAGAPVAAVCIH